MKIMPQRILAVPLLFISQWKKEVYHNVVTADADPNQREEHRKCKEPPQEFRLETKSQLSLETVHRKKKKVKMANVVSVVCRVGREIDKQNINGIVCQMAMDLPRPLSSRPRWPRLLR